MDISRPGALREELPSPSPNTEETCEAQLDGVSDRSLQLEQESDIETFKGKVLNSHILAEEGNGGAITLTRSRSDEWLPQPMIPLAHLSPMLQCSGCGAQPMVARTVHTCATGHQLCDHCYNAGRQTCAECSLPLDGRNKPLEELLRQMRQSCPDVFLGCYRGMSTGDKTTTPEPPRRLSKHGPVTCPHQDCHRRLGANSLKAHYQFEHQSVPRIVLQPQHTYSFSVTDPSVASTGSFVVSFIEVPVRTDDEQVLVQCMLLLSRVQVPSYVVDESGIDLMVAWIAALNNVLQPKLIYALQATSSLKGKKFSFQGPVSLLHQSQDVARVLTAAKALAIPTSCLPCSVQLIFQITK